MRRKCKGCYGDRLDLPAIRYRESMTMLLAIGATILLCLSAHQASAATYQVGPGKPYATLQAVTGILSPGDIVEVDGNQTYAGGVTFTRPGTEALPITIRGIRINGNRPVLSGGTNTVHFRTDDIGEGADHYIFEGFEVTGGTSRGIYHQADALLVRDVVVRDCPAHGILGADWGSGSCTLEFVEVYHCGSGDTRHQIYMATDQDNYPGSVFRMQFCYIHDGIGGNNVKSRAERNEIYYNWIEGAYYHELELIGRDMGEPTSAAPPREDSDVVGNVLFKRNTFFITRVGGDGTGETAGRYRFVNNTIIAGSSAVFRVFDAIESLEMHNNVFYRSGGAVNIIRTVEADWVNGQQISGSNNWVLTGASNIPTEWTGTIIGSDPGFTAFATNDLRPVAGSPLLNSGNAITASPSGYDFPTPLLPALWHPPVHGVTLPSDVQLRPLDTVIDIGAFERPGSMITRLMFLDTKRLAWAGNLQGTVFDIIRGDLALLIGSTGDFAYAVEQCLEDDSPDQNSLDSTAPGAGGFFYLVRGIDGLGSAESYDSGGPGQQQSRDVSIGNSPLSCP